MPNSGEVLRLQLGATPTILLRDAGGSTRSFPQSFGSVSSFSTSSLGVSLADPQSSSFSVEWTESCLRLQAHETLEVNGQPMHAGDRCVALTGDVIKVRGTTLEVCGDEASDDLLWRTSVGAAPEVDDLQTEIRRARQDPARCLGRYLLLNELGRGAFGCVYRAFDPKLERVVAVKILLQMSPQSRKRFEREAKVTAGLQHPNIVRLLDSGQHKGLPFLVMEFVPGRSLEDHANDHLLRLPPRERAVQTLDLLAPVADGLAHAHAHGILHRDLKPANILVAPDGSPFIVDFGLAHQEQADERLTLTGTALGTPLYMPFEQLAGEELDARADVYALGATYYSLLTGQAPRPATSPAELFDLHKTPAPPPSSIEPELPAVCDPIAQGCLASNIDDRYPDMATLADELRAARRRLDASPSATLPLAVLGGALVTIAAGLAALYATRSTPDPGPTAVATPAPAESSEAEATRPTPPVDEMALARIAAEEGRPTEALKRLDRVLSRTPDLGPALLLRGRLHLAAHRPRTAAVDLRRALQALPRDPQPAIALAQAEHDRDARDAFDAAVRQVEQRGAPAEALRLRARFALRWGDQTAAEAFATRLVQRPDATLDDRVLDARVQLELKRGQACHDRLVAVLAEDPDHLRALLLRTRLYISARRIAQAEADLKHLARIAPNSGEASALLAQLRAAQKRFPEATQAWLRGLRIDPHDLGVWRVLDIIRKHPSISRAVLKRGLEPLIAREPDHGLAHVLRFLVLIDLRRSPEPVAIAGLGRVIQADEGMVPRALYLRGMYWVQTGADPARGRADLKKFLKRTPAHPSAPHARRVLSGKQ